MLHNFYYQNKSHPFTADNGYTRSEALLSFTKKVCKDITRHDFKRCWKDNHGQGNWRDAWSLIADEVSVVVMGDKGVQKKIKVRKGSSLQGFMKEVQDEETILQVTYRDDEGDLIDIDDDATFNTILHTARSIEDEEPSLLLSVKSNTAYETPSEPTQHFKQYSHDGPVYGAKFLRSNPTDMFASCGRDGSVRIWSTTTTTGKDSLLHNEQHAHGTGFVLSLASHPSENLIVTGGDDHLGKIWSVTNNGNLILQKNLASHMSRIYAVSMSPDIIVTGGLDAKGVLWDVITGTERGPLNTMLTKVLTCDFSPCGRYVALSGDGVGFPVVIYEVRSGKEAAVLKGQHTATVWSIAFSPDGSYLASVSMNSELVVWSLLSRSAVSCSRTHRPAHCVGYHGGYLLTAGRDGGVTFHSNEPALPGFFHASPERDIIYSFDVSGGMLLTASSNCVARSCALKD
eukprot:TRINITY_DN16604_c1_g2_i1.p1 TRINITY_DN16604_c1_g2~~TRINITY_DN16604_c1_g2_i1.p1  ORF type:complete len:488 (+),score=65.85 TRINITY_DN16604_c1_g2_i1:94-1464(+)